VLCSVAVGHRVAPKVGTQSIIPGLQRNSMECEDDGWFEDDISQVNLLECVANLQSRI
jgi:hypothetical protein